MLRNLHHCSGCAAAFLRNQHGGSPCTWMWCSTSRSGLALAKQGVFPLSRGPGDHAILESGTVLEFGWQDSARIDEPLMGDCEFQGCEKETSQPSAKAIHNFCTFFHVILGKAGPLDSGNTPCCDTVRTCVKAGWRSS